MAGIPTNALRVFYAAMRAAQPTFVMTMQGRRTCMVFRHDDVKQVLRDDRAFGATYAEKLKVVVGDAPFILGLPDGPEYRAQLKALQAAVTEDDIARRLPEEAERLAEAVVAQGGPIEVVGMARRITSQVLGRYFGLFDAPGEQDLATLETQADTLFRFQFADPENDPALRRRAEADATALGRTIADRVAGAPPGGPAGPETLIARYLRAAPAGGALDEATIRAAITGFVVGGLPQPPMVVPQALDQLLRRPEALVQARRAAQDGGDRFAGFVFEAMRFDPLAPALERVTLEAVTVAPGSRYARTLPQGTRVLAFFASAMLDPRRVEHPHRFDPDRHPSAYLHFGHGLHECFAKAINRKLLPAMLRPLLRAESLRRAPGPRGRLAKDGIFARSLEVMT